MRYEVVDLEAPRSTQSHGWYDSIEEARGCVAYDRLRSWQIWSRDEVLVAERDLGLPRRAEKKRRRA